MTERRLDRRTAVARIGCQTCSRIPLDHAVAAYLADHCLIRLREVQRPIAPDGKAGLNSVYNRLRRFPAIATELPDSHYRRNVAGRQRFQCRWQVEKFRIRIRAVPAELHAGDPIVMDRRSK